MEQETDDFDGMVCEVLDNLTGHWLYRLALLANMGCLPPYCLEAVTYCTRLQVPRSLTSS